MASFTLTDAGKAFTCYTVISFSQVVPFIAGIARIVTHASNARTVAFNAGSVSIHIISILALAAGCDVIGQTVDTVGVGHIAC